jgi:hypothetical protein
MAIIRLLVVSAVHAALAGYFAAMAQQWIPVSSGRASPLTLFAPAPVFLDQVWAAAIAGAVLGPGLHAIFRRSVMRQDRPRWLAPAIGIGYAMAVMFVTILIWMPWVTVQGRGPGESVASALRTAAFLLVFGTPLFMATFALLLAPVLIIGGAAIGLAAMTIERRPSSTRS